MASKIKVDTIENVAGSGNVSLGSGHNLVVPGNITGSGTATITGDLTVDTNTLHVDSSNNLVGIGTSSPLSLTGNAAPGLTVSSNGPFILLQDANNANKVRYISNNTGELQLGQVNDDGSTNKTLHLNVSTDGYVTKPLQPSFSARGQDANWRAAAGNGSTWAGIGGTSYSATSGNWQQGSNFTTSGHYGARNVGNCFVNATAIFTAPIAGNYFFQIRMYLNRTNTSSPGIYLNPRINNTATDGSAGGIQGSYHLERTTMSNSNNAYIPFGREDIYYMAANDTFTYALNPEAAGFQLYGSYTEFKGYLIG